jgi:hypothetical protein
MNEDKERQVLQKLSKSKEADVRAFAKARLLELVAIEMDLISVGEVKLHLAARQGNLDKVPEEYMTEENLRRIEGAFGTKNVFHVAAEYGHLWQIPKEFLTAENLMLPRGDGYTALELAADGQLDQIPVAELTPEKLGLDSFGRNYVLHLAAESRSLHQLPRSVLVEKYLMGNQYNHQNVLQIAKRKGCLDQLLGVELSEATRKFVGDEWWGRNQAVLREKSKLDGPEEQAPDVELY